MKQGSKKIKVLIADDHGIVRAGLASILGFEDDIAVVGEANNGLHAVEQCKALRPDVIIMDLMMP
jgi:DNA-binding NarL/FixJ family response regulator